MKVYIVPAAAILNHPNRPLTPDALNIDDTRDARREARCLQTIARAQAELAKIQARRAARAADIARLGITVLESTDGR
jgi:hypothetical protein